LLTGFPERPQHNPPHAASKNKRESPEIEELQGHRSSLIRERDVVEKQRTILDAYSKTVSSEHAKSDALSDFLRTYGTSQLEYSTQLHELEEKIRAVDEKIKDAREAEGKLAGDSKLGTRVVVVVLAEEDGPAELDLKYNVTGASWTPVYDLRAEVANAGSETNGEASGKAPATATSNSKISLDYRASISQRTAEDWKNVNLTLSIASPQLGSVIPKLSAVRLDGISHAIPMKKAVPAKELRSRGAPAGSALMHSATAEEYESDDDMGFGIFDDGAGPQADTFGSAPAPAAPQFFAHAGSKVSGSGEGFSSAFVIDGLSNIPSDTDDSSESHKVTIAVVQLDNVDLEWVTVPKRSLSVFLKVTILSILRDPCGLTIIFQARVKNTTEYTFLAGGASIFMNNNFVAKSNIPVSPFLTPTSSAPSPITNSSIKQNSA
jgi:hypothetical protein